MRCDVETWGAAVGCRSRRARWTGAEIVHAHVDECESCWRSQSWRAPLVGALPIPESLECELKLLDAELWIYTAQFAKTCARVRAT